MRVTAANKNKKRKPDKVLVNEQDQSQVRCPFLGRELFRRLCAFSSKAKAMKEKTEPSARNSSSNFISLRGSLNYEN